MIEPKPVAFVVMPFSEDFHEVFEYIITPPLEDQYDVRLASGETHQRNVLADIVRGIDGAYLVVADLTGLNANVMWELGVAHALGKRTLILTQDDPAELPFDLKNYRVLRYTTRKGRQAEADGEVIRSIGRDALSGLADFGNPVIDFRLASELSPVEPWDLGGSTQLESGEPALLDLAADAEATLQRLSQHFDQLGEITAWIGEQAEKHRDAMVQWKLRGSQGGMARAKELTDAAARDLFEYRRLLHDELDGLRKCNDLLRETMLPYLRIAPIDSGEDRVQDLADLESSGRAWRSAIEASKQAMNAVEGFREIVGGLKGVTGRVNAAAGQTGRQLDEMIKLMQENQVIMQEIVDITDQRMSELGMK